MNPRLPYNPYHTNSSARPAFHQLGPKRARFEVPFDRSYGHFGGQLATRFYYFSASIAAQVDLLTYIPVEISIVQFSFEEGVVQSFHRVLEQNNIPKGLSYDCALQQMKHRIDAEAHAEEADKMNSLFGDIVSFYGDTSEMVFFCEDLKLKQNIRILYLLKEKHREHQNPRCTISVRVYGIQQLADHFLASSGSTVSRPNVSRLMQKAFFDSYLTRQCHYHRVLKSNLCTEDDAHKVAYAFLFAMAVVHQLPLDTLPIPGFADMKSFLEKIAMRFAK